MSYTLGQAAKATGKDRATISRAIKSGKVSAEKDAHGQWAIDPAELHRVYPPATLAHPRAPEADAPTRTPDKTDALQAIIDGMRGELEQVRSERDDLRRRLDEEAEERRREAEERRKLVALLTAPREPEHPWWQFWKGRPAI